MEEKISVIVPVYNVKSYFEKCIESIVNQTYKNLEIILVDNGSIDGSGTICDEYAKKDSRVVVKHKEPGGPSEARNIGLDMATGDYISFVDSDDYMDSNMFEVLYSDLKANDCDISMCGYIRVNSDGEPIATDDSALPIATGVYTKQEMFEKLCGKELCQCVVVWNKLYKKHIFDNLRFVNGMIHEDEMIAHRIIDRCEKVSCNETKLYNYVRRADSIMTRGANINSFDGTTAFFDRTCFFLEKNMGSLAEKSFAFCTAHTLKVLSGVDLKDKAVKARIRDIKKQYRKLVFKVIGETNSKRRKLLYILSLIDLKLAKSVFKVRMDTKTRGR